MIGSRISITHISSSGSTQTDIGTLESTKPIIINLDYPLSIESGDRVECLLLDFDIKNYLNPKSKNFIVENYTGGKLRLKGDFDFKREESSIKRIVQSSIKDGQEYLQNYNKELASKVIENATSGYLISSIGGQSYFEQVEFEIDNNNILHFELPQQSLLRHHLIYNSRIELLIPMDKGYYFTVKDVTQTENKYFGRLVEFRFDDQSNLETVSLSTETKWSSIVNQIFSNTKYWVKLFRSEILLVTLIPLLISIGIIGFDNIAIHRLPLIIVGLLFVQAGASLLNDYYDHINEVDEYNLYSSIVSGGSRFIQNKLISPERSLVIGIICLLISGSIGLYLNFISSGNLLIGLILLGGIISIFYTAGPIRLVYRGLGELILGLTFGPFLMTGSFIVLSYTSFVLTKSFVIYSLIHGIFIAIILLLTGFQDYEVDRLVGKRTTVVRLGRHKTLIIILFLFILILLLTGYVALLVNNSIIQLLPLLLSPLLLFILWSIWESHPNYSQLNKNIIKFIITYDIWGILTFLSLILSGHL